MPDESTRRARYVAYMASPEWQQKRRRALDRAGGRCQVCNTDRGLDVHHRTYERFGDERADDLTVLCRDCHRLFHSTQRKPTRTRKPKKAKGPARQPSKRDTALAAENERLAALQTRNREQRAAAEAARAPRVVVLRPGEGVRS